MEYAVRERDIGRRGFQHVRGDLLALVDHLVGGEQQRRAADGIEREPPVPPPKPIASLSPCRTRIFSTSMPSSLRAGYRRSRVPGQTIACRISIVSVPDGRSAFRRTRRSGRPLLDIVGEAYAATPAARGAARRVAKPA